MPTYEEEKMNPCSAVDTKPVLNSSSCCDSSCGSNSDMETATLTGTTIVTASTTDDVRSEEESFREQLISDKELSECDVIDLHLLGSIQGGGGGAYDDDTGHVLFISYPEGKVVAADQDVYQLPIFQEGLMGQQATTKDANYCKKLIGTLLSQWIPKPLEDRINATLAEMVRTSSERSFCFWSNNGRQYALSFSTTKSDHSLIGIEIELTKEGEMLDKSFHNTFLYLGKLVDFHSNDAAAKKACDVMFDLLDTYDRGMVYRFNDDLSGEIIHEIKRPHITTSYLGHLFPASDIPKSARLLYKKNLLRYVHNVNSEDIPLVARLEEGQIDLTQIRSRACHIAHKIYMRNMGVCSSMSMAIVVEDELWGLIAFHAYDKPIKPSLQQRIACETISSMVSSRAETLMKKAQSARIVGMGETLMLWRQGSSLEDNVLTVGDNVLQMAEADVLVGLVENSSTNTIDRVVIGDESLVPHESFFKKLENTPNRMICAKSTRSCMAEMGLTKDDCPAAGFCYFREGRTQIMLGRAWRARDVKWAGNPDEPKLRIGGILCPRNSFETQMQAARQESRAWTPSDQLVISMFRDRVCTEHCHNWIVTLLNNDIEEANLRYFNALERADDNNNFFASMCHELRTPFHGVMGCLNIIHDTFDDMKPEEVKDLVKTALSSGYHMVNLLNDILNKSKNKYLSTANFQDTVPFQDLANDAVKGMISMARNLNVLCSLKIVPSDASVYVVTDRTKVIQITTNIINNAIKFTRPYSMVDIRFSLEDSIHKCIRVWEKDSSMYDGRVFSFKGGEMLTSIEDVKNSIVVESSKRWLMISVADSGPGMKAEELSEMFQPYVQARMARSRPIVQGTGLGLYICATLCQQLRGFLACSSTPEQGTVFHVGIPVDVKSQPDESENDIVELPKDISISGPIMVVDDNKVNVKILKRALTLEFKKAGINLLITSASGGAAAIERFKAELPSLVIIDYHMPDIDGLEATKAIRKFEKERGLQPSYILSYTADASGIARDNLLASGANEIMAKPPPPNFLKHLVSRFNIEAHELSIHKQGQVEE